MQIRACRPTLLAALLVAGLVGIAAAKKAKKPVFGRVLPLTGEPYMGDDDQINFDEVISARPFVIVNFMVDCVEGADAGMDADMVKQCNKCRSFKPSFSKLTKTNIALTFGQVDVEAEEALATKYGVTIAPTLVLFLNGTATAKYSGSYAPEAVLEWVTQVTRLSHIKSEYDLGKAVSARAKGDVLVVARGTAQVGNMLSETNVQVYLEGKSAHMRYAFLATGEDKFSLQVHRGMNEAVQFEMTPGNEIFAEDFVAFVQKERNPSFGMLSSENVKSVVDAASGGLVLLCLEQSDLLAAAGKLTGTFKTLSRKFKKYSFVCGDTRQGNLVDSVPACEQFPSVIFRKGALVVKKPFEKAELDEKSVSVFLKEAAKAKTAEL